MLVFIAFPKPPYLHTRQDFFNEAPPATQGGNGFLEKLPVHFKDPESAGTIIGTRRNDSDDKVAPSSKWLLG